MNWFGRHLTWFTTPVIVALLLLGWQAYVTLGGVSKFIVPEPWAVIVALVEFLQLKTTYWHIGFTLYETIVGFLIATILGVSLGLLLGKVRWLERALQPVLVGLQVIPKIVLVPLFILWFGFGVGSKILIAAVLAFLPIMSNTLLGVKSVEPGHQEVMKSLSSGRFDRFRLLELPSAMPYILTGMEIGIILAMIGAIVGEFLAGTNGLGHVAIAALNAFEVDLLFADIVLLAFMGAFLYVLVVMLRRLLIGWHTSSQSGML